MAGFRSPAFWLGISATPVQQQAGFRTALPFFFAGVTDEIIEPVEDLIGVGFPQAGDYRKNRARILREDDEILAVIIAHTMH